MSKIILASSSIYRQELLKRLPIKFTSTSPNINEARIHDENLGDLARRLSNEKAEVISGSQIILNPKILGYKTMAFIGIYLDKAIRNTEAVKQLEEIDEVIECHYTTGNWSIFLKLLCKDNEHLMELLNKKIQSVEGVARTETFISLQQQLNRQISL